MSGSVFITKQFEFIEKTIAERNKKRFRNSAILSLLLHLLLAVGVIFLSLSPFFRKADLQSKIFVVEQAEYKPFPSKDKPETADTPIEQPVEPEQKPIIVEQKKNPLSLQKYRAKPDFSWRENVAKMLPEKKQPVAPSEKITISKTQPVAAPAADNKLPNVSQRQMNAYLMGIASIFRSHWTLPEDLGHKFYSLSCEITLNIDFAGNIKKVDITRSSGNSSFDFYAKDAVLKTKRIPLPSKEIFESLSLSDKITLEFKP